MASGPGIGGYAIGPGQPVYVIAEIGVNHDGDAGRALELVDAAAEAGADAVKTQHFRTDLLLSREARLASYQASAGESDAAAMLRRLELDPGDIRAACARAQERGLGAIMTAFSVELVDELAGLGLDALKSASTDITNRPLLEAMAARGLPLIVSTGASTIEEVERAAGWLSGVRQVALLQCVSAYPAPDDGLDGIGAIAGAIGRIAGYSDHTPREDTGAAAVACGASILEKHLTLDRAAPGPDHAASLAPDGFARYVRLARAQGAVPEPAPRPREAKGVLACEAEVRRASRQSVVSARALEAGTVVGRSDLAIKRPGTGIEPHRFEEVVGRRVVRAIEADVPIRGEDVGLAESGAGVSRLETGSTECV